MRDQYCGFKSEIRDNKALALVVVSCEKVPAKVVERIRLLSYCDCSRENHGK